MEAESEFPPLYVAADRNSLDGQRRFLGATRLRLVMLVVAATFGLFTWRAGGGGADLAGIGAAVAFVVALVAELYLLQARPDRRWYDGRAVAESAKTLTWRYLVGGRPFGRDEVSDREAEQLLLDRFGQIAGDLRGAHLVPVTGAADQLGPTLRRLPRGQPRRAPPALPRSAASWAGRPPSRSGPISSTRPRRPSPASTPCGAPPTPEGHLPRWPGPGAGGVPSRRWAGVDPRDLADVAGAPRCGSCFRRWSTRSTR